MELRSELHRKLSRINDDSATLVLTARVMLEDRAESYLLHVDAESFVNDYDCNLFDMVFDKIKSLGEVLEEEFVFELFELDNQEIDKYCSACVDGPINFCRLREVVAALEDDSIEVVDAGLAIDVPPGHLEDAFCGEVSVRGFDQDMLTMFQETYEVPEYLMQYIDEEKVINSFSEDFTESNGYIFRDNY